MTLEARPKKKRRISNEAHLAHSADELYEWTRFRQSTGEEVLKGLNKFNDYLSSLANQDSRSQHFQAIQQYCQWEKAPSEDEPEFPDLLSTWSLALDNNDEAVTTAVPNVLAQLLRTISGILDLRASGLALVDSLLKRDRSKYFDKSFVRGKTHLAQPCVELLREMLEFDAGARSFEFWLRRDVVLPKLEHFLDLRNAKGDGALRKSALRLVLSMLKYVDGNGKSVLLFQARALHVVLTGRTNNESEIILEVLEAFRKQLVDDAKVSREAVRSFFTWQRLDLLARLFRVEAEYEIREAIRNSVQQLLLELCTTERGVLTRKEVKKNKNIIHPPTQGYLDLGIESPYYQQQRQTFSGAEREMLAFVSRLQPFEDELQSKLLLKVLQVWPALLVSFTSKCQKLPEPDAEDSKWRAQFAFIYALVESKPQNLEQLDLDAEYYVEAILPHPLDRSYLNKLLKSSDQVLRISGARLLTVAVQKLLRTLSAFENDQSMLSRQTTDQIVELCEERLPATRDVSLALQQTDMDEVSTLTALLECLRAYLQVMPDTSPFDVSPIMNSLCTKAEADPETAIIEALAICAEIADLSSATKWLHKTSATMLSPLTRLLRISSSNTATDSAIIGKVLVQRGVLFNTTSFSALHNSLMRSSKFEATESVYQFLDNCLGRAAARPVKYLDIVEAASQELSDKKPMSLLAAAITEQWLPFTKSNCKGKSEVKEIAAWIARFLALLEMAGENYRVMMHGLQGAVEADEKYGRYLNEAMEKAKKKLAKDDIQVSVQDVVMGDVEPTKDDETTIPNENSLPVIASIVILIPDSLEGLDKWSTTGIDIDFEVETKRFEKLLLCTASSDDEIRIQAYQTLQSIIHTTDTTSQHPEKQRIWLVFSELAETITRQNNQPLPTILPVLASRLLEITLDPTHDLYVKANKYLLSRPYWSGKRVISFWMDRIMYQQPTNDDDKASQVELSWLLNLLLAGVQTQVDLDLYRRLCVWEKIASLYSSPNLKHEHQLAILATIWRAIELENGTVMLWTRFGMDAWLSTLTDPAALMVRDKMQPKRDEVKTWEVACALTKAQ